MQQSHNPRRSKGHHSAGQFHSRTVESPFCPNIEGYETIFKSLSVGATLQRPPAEVTLNLQGIDGLVAEIIADLKPMGFQSKSTDVATLTTALKLQVYAKVAIARRKAPVENSSINSRLVRTILNSFSKGLKSMAAYIGHVGAFELEGQTIVPRLPADPTIPDGFVKTNVQTGKGTLYVDNRENPVNIDDFDALFELPENRRKIVSRDRFTNIHNDSMHYYNFLTRCSCNLPIIDLDLASGQGTAAQIVGSKSTGEVSEEVLALCYRSVPPTTMVAGAGFQFGYASSDPWHVEGPQVVHSSYVDVRLFLLHLVSGINDGDRNYNYSSSD